MLVTIGAPEIASSDVTGAKVATRRLTFSSQQEAIMYLRGIVDAYRGTYAIVARARDIAFRQAYCPPRDQLCQALAIARYVQQNVTYVAELPERFQTPTTTLAEKYGDCDDFTTTIAALCEAIGIETELVGMEWGPPHDRYFRHIFPRALIPQKGGRIFRLPLDATLTRPVDDRANPIEIALKQGANLRLFIA